MSNLSFSRKIALRYLWSKRSEAFITILTVISILGVAIGVTVLNITMAIMTGFESELREKIIGANSHIVVHSATGRIEEWKSAEEKIRAVPGVVSVSPFTYNQALLKVDNRSVGMLIRGITEGSRGAEEVSTYTKTDPDAVKRMFHPEPVDIFDEEGKPAEATLPGIIVGKELVRSYGIPVGSIVSVLSPNVTSTPLGLVPKFRRFVVAGIYNSGLVEYESSIAYASMSEAQGFFKLGQAVSGLEVRVQEVDKSSIVAKGILDALSDVPGNFIAQDWTEQNKPLWEAIKLEKRVYFIVLLLIVVMASFSIISTLVMIVLEKRKDIGVLKTLGASSKSIARIFRIQGAVIGAIGTVLGLILAYAGCKLLQIYGFPLDERIFQMSTVPIRIVPLNFVVVGCASFLICLFATHYPSRRASSLSPTEVLRS